MKFTPLIVGAQAISLFSLLPIAVQNALSLDEPVSSPSGNKHVFPGTSTVQNCEAGRPQLLNVTELNFTPEAPALGQSLTIDLKGTLLSNVTAGAYVDVMVKSANFAVEHTRQDLCSWLSGVETECPVGPGEVELSKTIDLPATLTPGEYTVLAKAYDAAGDLLTCLFTQVVLV